MHIVFAASECVPFSKTGGLADVVGALPRALVTAGHQVSVYLPRYRETLLKDARTVVKSVTVPFDDQYRFCSIVSGGERSGVNFYFVEYPPFFDRDALYGTSAGDYPDNAERFALFSRAVLEGSKILGVPQIFHCHDWQSALVPILLRTQYAEDPAFRDVSTVFTIHNMGYQGIFSSDTLPLLTLPWDLFTISRMEFFGNVNFLKGALIFSDFITTVSKKYSQEIQTTEFGFGLEGVLRTRSSTVTGILNGVDYDEWSPETDKFITARYSPLDLSGKAQCKEDLLKTFGIVDADLRLDARARIEHADLEFRALCVGEAQRHGGADGGGAGQEGAAPDLDGFRGFACHERFLLLSPWGARRSCLLPALPAGRDRCDIVIEHYEIRQFAPALRLGQRARDPRQ